MEWGELKDMYNAELENVHPTYCNDVPPETVITKECGYAAEQGAAGQAQWTGTIVRRLRSDRPYADGQTSPPTLHQDQCIAAGATAS